VRILSCTLFVLATGVAWPQTSPLVRILDEELQRNFVALKQKGDPPPYYMSYAVSEQENQTVSAAMGAVLAQNKGHARFFDISVRVGSPKLDNYHRIRGDQGHFTSGVQIAVEDGADAIKRRAWLETDRAYNAAAQRLIQIKTNQQVKLAQEDDSDDFSSEPPATFNETPPSMKFNSAEWASRLRKLSSEFSRYPSVLNSNVTVSIRHETKYFVNTEGSKIQQGRNIAQIIVAAQAKASDGMDLALGETFEADDPAHLPNEDAIRKAIDKTGEQLTALLHAPVVDPYVGPAILSGHAAGVFFHEIFGHRVEGHRQKDDAEGQTFTKSVNGPVLPAFLSVIFDPTRRSLNGTYLNGAYSYDDEGVKARPVTVVDHGILKTFLLSRSPIKGFPNSNGHGRRQPGAEVVSRQSNLIVESANSVPEAKLREMLRDELKKQNKPWGLYFSRVTGGYTLTGRRGLQAFTVMPLVVYRVYADGRPDELVRGVDIVGTPLASFAKIMATSNRQEVFNGICGAESGSVPVSAVAPAMLISEIEIQRKDRSQDRPPLLPRPPDANTSAAAGGQQ
jgi:TldD protein